MISKYLPYIVVGGAIALLMTIKKTTSDISREDTRKWLARVVIAEAGDIEGPCSEWAAIMQIVLNRVRSSQYPSTVKNVVRDRSWNLSDRYQELIRNAHNSPRWENALLQADRVLSGEERNLVGQRLHECHKGGSCSPDGTKRYNDRRQHKWTCYQGHWMARWALPLSHPDSTAQYEPIQIGRVIVS